MPATFDKTLIDRALALLEARLQRNHSLQQRLVICGGSALIANGFVSRTTKDLDVVALMDESEHLFAPVPLPPELIAAAREVAPFLEVDENWLNNGPSSDEGGLFQMGLPEGFVSRLTRQDIGSHLTVYWAGRLDQVCFKVYAATDRGGRHLNDLRALKPTEGELETAARWAMTHDVSPGFKQLLRQLLDELGHEKLAARL